MWSAFAFFNWHFIPSLFANRLAHNSRAPTCHFLSILFTSKRLRLPCAYRCVVNWGRKCFLCFGFCAAGVSSDWGSSTLYDRSKPCARKAESCWLGDNSNANGGKSILFIAEQDFVSTSLEKFRRTGNKFLFPASYNNAAPRTPIKL